MRRTFAEIVASAGVNALQQYRILYNLFTEPFSDENGLHLICRAGPYFNEYSQSFREVINFHFMELPIRVRRSYRNLVEFDRGNGFVFKRDTVWSNELDQLLTYIEYTLSLISVAKDVGIMRIYEFAERAYARHAATLLDDMGMCQAFKDGFVFVAPKSAPVVEVARMLPEDLSYKTFMYNHRSYTGALEKKKEVLRSLGDALEPRRSELKTLDSSLTSDVFALLNCANVRHNNIDERDPAKYQPVIAAMNTQQLESVYDDLYQMELLAFMWLDSREVVSKTKGFVETLKP